MTGCAPTATRQSTGEYIDDTTVTSRVKAALVKEPGIKSNAIEVETYRGVVSLSGFVDSPEMASKAVSTATSVGGVKSVKNDMRIKPSY
jgi:hyperosmotically inducible protein